VRWVDWEIKYSLRGLASQHGGIGSRWSSSKENRERLTTEPPRLNLPSFKEDLVIGASFSLAKAPLSGVV